MNPLKRGKRIIDGKLNARSRRIIESTVKSSAARLDTEYPGWARHVKLSELNFENACKCVYGQLEIAASEATRGPLAKKGEPLTFLQHEYEGDTSFNRLEANGWSKSDIIGYVVPDAAYNAAGLNPSDLGGDADLQKSNNLWAYQENCWRDEIRERARYDLPVAA